MDIVDYFNYDLAIQVKVAKYLIYSIQDLNLISS